MNAKTLQAILKLKDELSPKLKGIQGRLKVFAGEAARLAKWGFVALSAAATAAAIAFRKLIGDAIAYGVSLDKVAKQTSMTTEEFSRLSYAAEQEHASIESINKSIPILSKYMEYARMGMATYSREFKKMGVSVTDLNGNLRSTYDVLLDMADYYATATNKTQALAIATTLLGRRGAELVPLLRLGKEGIKALGSEADRLGIVMDQKTASAMKEFDDRLTTIRNGIKGASIQITKGLLPALQVLGSRIENINWGDERIQMWAKRVVFNVIELFETLSKFAFGVQTVWRGLVAVMMEIIRPFINMGSDFKIFMEEIKIAMFTATESILVKIQEWVQKIKPLARSLRLQFVDDIDKGIGAAISNFGNHINDSKNAIDAANLSIKANNQAVMAQWFAVENSSYSLEKASKVIEEFSGELKNAKISLNTTSDAIKDNSDALDDLGSGATNAATSVKTFADHMQAWGKSALDTAKITSGYVTQAFDGIADGTAKSFRDMLETGKNFGDSMTEMMRNLMFDLVQEILSSQIKSAFAGIFNLGGGAGAGGAGGGMGGIIGTAMSFIGGLFGHNGGMVTPNGIKRFHKGGGFNLAADERPAILQVGERVLNRRETAEYSKGGNTGPIYITINALDPQSFSSYVRSHPEAILGVVGENMSRNGQLRGISRSI